MKKQQGFTLIELVVVIVILGILAATALPKFIDVTDDAEKAAIQGVAGGLSSASAINYGGCSLTSNVPGAKCIKVSKCSEVGALLTPALTLGIVAPTTPGYYLKADTDSKANGTGVTCTLQKDKGTTAAAFTADFTAIGAGN